MWRDDAASTALPSAALIHDLDTAVLRPPGLVAILGDRRERAEAARGQAPRVDAIARRQRRRHRLGAALRQADIVVELALIVGVADDEDLAAGMVGEELRHLGELRLGIR